MTTTALTSPSMTFAAGRPIPLHVRLWRAFEVAGANRAAGELRRQGLLRADSDPGLSRKLFEISQSISSK